MTDQTTTTDKNIFIQDVSEKTMTINVNGEVREIQNQLSELKELLKNHNASNITYENKVYNIEHINEANFGVVTSNKMFNGILTKELVLLLQNNEETQRFLDRLPAEDKDNWPGISQHLHDAQGILVDSFVWVIGDELRRLFSIGKEKKESIESRIDKYITHCLCTYRISLQLINYLFISKLWDEKNKNRNLDADKNPVRNFFNANRALKLAEIRTLFLSLIEIFRTNQLEFPLEASDLRDINEFLQPDSKFSKACKELEKLEALDQEKEMYGLGHCHTAEISLTTILSSFIFLTNYQLVSLKKIEYEESRNSAARYIKDLNILKNILVDNETKNLLRYLKYDNTPQLTYSVFFRNKNISINLFPFLLDYNALTNQDDFQLFFFQCRDSESGLRYYSIKSEKEQTINYMATATGSMEIKSDLQKNELQKNIRLDTVAKQFEEAMNTILGTNFNFKPKVNNLNADSLSNL